MIMSFIFPILAMALEEISSPAEIFNILCKASIASPQECRQFTLYSKKHKLYFVFFAAYTDPTDFDHVFIFRNKLEVTSFSFYLNPSSAQATQVLDRGFHPDIMMEDKINYLSEVSVSPKAVYAGYYLNKKYHRSAVFLYNVPARDRRCLSCSEPHPVNGIRFLPVNGKIGKIQEIKPALSDITPPRRLSMPFDLSEISAEGKNLPQEKLSAKSVKKIGGGFLFRTLKDRFYYIRDTADGIYLTVFVDGNASINCRFTNNHVISQLSAKNRFVQVFSTFNPFKCEIFFNSPDQEHPLFIKVRNDDCKREIFTINAIRGMAK